MPSMEENEAVKKLMNFTRIYNESKSHLFYLPISVQQAATTGDHPAKGQVWASRTTFPAPKDDEIVTVIREAVHELDDNCKENLKFSVADVNVQWSGFRSGVGKMEPEPNIPEREKYNGLMKDVNSKTTIIYVHGGLNYYGGPAYARPVTATLARLTKGRCLVLEQRLCPQHPFPAPLMDLLVAYLSLLYPPEHAFHEAVSSKDIVMAGESSGGNLCLGFLLLLQYLRQRKEAINFHGHNISIPYPAGFATYGANGDLTSSLPSYVDNTKYDIVHDCNPTNSHLMKPCSLWPSKPPRSHIYAPTTNLITHPLLSPASSKSWPNVTPPPLFFAYGQERLIDEGKFMAKQASRAGAKVQFHQYNALPHIFAYFCDIPQTTHLFSSWANFCRTCVENPKAIESNQYYIYEPVGAAPFFKATARDIGDGLGFTDLEYDRVLALMDAKKKTFKIWTGSRPSL